MIFLNFIIEKIEYFGVMIFSKSVFEGLEVLPFRRPAERGATPGPFAETPVHMIVPRVVRAEHAAQALRPVPGGARRGSRRGSVGSETL